MRHDPYGNPHAMRGKRARWAQKDEAKPAPVNRHTIGRLLSFARPYWWQLGSVLIATSLTSTLSLLYPALIGKIIDTVIIAHNSSALQSIITLLIGVVIAQSILRYWQMFWSSVIGEKVVIDLRIKLYSHIQKLPLAFFQDNHTGELLSRLTNDVMLVRNAITNNVTALVQNLFTLVAGVAVIVIGPDALLNQAAQFNVHIPTSHATLFNPATLWVLLLVPFVTLPYLLTSGLMRRMQKRSLEILSEATTAAEEAIGNAKIVKAFAREQYEVNRYTTLAQQQYGIARKIGRTMGLVNGISNLLSFGGLVIFLWFIARSVMDGQISVGNLTMTVMYIFILIQPLTSASNLYSQFQMALGASERIFDLLDEPITIKDAPDAPPLPPLQGNLSFEQVEFSYDGMVKVLHEVSFAAQAGQVVALVGPSGAGKTTIANLIPRFFDIQSGRITLDGYDISTVQLQSLREQIGIVLQEPVLFGMTVRENIAYGRQDATQAEIEEVARAANAQEFIEKLPQGYDTLVGERGVKLSVGQRQRVAIARALLRNPRILILDEATSSLDNESESLVQEALDRLMRNRTTVVIAHRLTTIEHADKIIVLEQGRVVEQGSHEELLTQRGMYYRLYMRSFQEREPEEV